jgi:hypothetical protein
MVFNDLYNQSMLFYVMLYYVMLSCVCQLKFSQRAVNFIGGKVGGKIKQNNIKYYDKLTTNPKNYPKMKDVSAPIPRTNKNAHPSRLNR